MDEILGGFGPVAVVVVPALVIASASIFDALVPTPLEGTPLWYVKRVIAWLAVNVGHAKNAE